MTVIDSKLNSIINTLEQAIYESETAVDDVDKGYPYAAGYARSALKMVLDDVKNLQTYMDEVKN